MAVPTTLKIYLNQLRWQFYEKGMQRVWNDLVKFANSTTEGTIANGVKVNTISMTTNCSPDFVPGISDVTEGRDGVGGLYADKKYPSFNAGFIAQS